MDDDSHRPIDDADGHADADALRDVIRSNRSARRERLRAHIRLLHGEINKPLAGVVRDRVLHYLPACSLLRLRAVAPSWDRFISSPFFAHTQSHSNRCISGVFFGSPPSAYVHFPPASAHKIPNAVLPFLPACPVSVLFSSNGLLLCFDEVTSTFYVCNPVTAAWSAIPCPPCDPGNDPAAVLIFLPGVYNFRPDFSIVLPFRIGDSSSGFLGFQTFSSSVGGWWVSNEMCEVESLHSGSGIVAGSAAYWQTTMFTVVRYDPARDSVQTVPWPMGHVVGIRWAIGEMGGSGRLYCVAVTRTSVQVHKLLGKSGEWAMIESMMFQDLEACFQVDELFCELELHEQANASHKEKGITLVAVEKRLKKGKEKKKERKEETSSESNQESDDEEESSSSKMQNFVKKMMRRSQKFDKKDVKKILTNSKRREVKKQEDKLKKKKKKALKATWDDSSSSSSKEDEGKNSRYVALMTLDNVESCKDEDSHSEDVDSSSESSSSDDEVTSPKLDKMYATFACLTNTLSKSKEKKKKREKKEEPSSESDRESSDSDEEMSAKEVVYYVKKMMGRSRGFTRRDVKKMFTSPRGKI
ncbi:uncharacterized protein LOC141829127 [Curcuma longa]|uniref:uncharacterized protein LOC141829127 n=1 Tax=Curcuma longa TaxID=136217 RepID=UPI003D9E596E